MEWLNCAAGGSHVPDQFEQPSPCSRIGYPSHLSVRIVLAGRSVREDIFGEAYTDSQGKGTYIKLYYARLAEPNAHLPLGEGELLGCVIAHEVGHLLLGTDSHSHEGIMQGHWEDPQLREAGKGNLQFTPSQAGLMREHLAGEQKKKEVTVAHRFRCAVSRFPPEFQLLPVLWVPKHAKCDPPSSATLWPGRPELQGSVWRLGTDHLRRVS